jgi:hypothetical protein
MSTAIFFMTMKEYAENIAHHTDDNNGFLDDIYVEFSLPRGVFIVKKRLARVRAQSMSNHGYLALMYAEMTGRGYLDELI